MAWFLLAAHGSSTFAYHLLAVVGLFQINGYLGSAGILYIVADWVKAIIQHKSNVEGKDIKELREKLIREGNLNE